MVLRDFILIVLGIVVAYLAPFLQDSAHSLLTSRSGWRAAMIGAGRSWKGLLIVIIIAGLLAFGLGKYDERQAYLLNKDTIDRHTELLQAIEGIRADDQRLYDLLERLNDNLEQNTEMLERLGTDNATRSTTE